MLVVASRRGRELERGVGIGVLAQGLRVERGVRRDVDPRQQSSPINGTVAWKPHCLDIEPFDRFFFSVHFVTLSQASY